MKKLLAPVLVAALAFAVAYFAWQTSCDKRDYVSKAQYDAAVKERDAKIADALAVIDGKDKVIVQKTAEIAAILQSVGQPTQAEKAKDATIAELERRVAAFESQGDLRAALDASKAECAAWAEKFSLAEARWKKSLTDLNDSWQVKFDAKDEQYKAALAMYDTEHGLRLSGEALNKALKRQIKRDRILKWAVPAATFIFGNLAHK